MTEEQAINYIKKYCFTKDIEENHSEADRALILLLISLGYPEVDEWEKIIKWYA